MCGTGHPAGRIEWRGPAVPRKSHAVGAYLAWHVLWTVAFIMTTACAAQPRILIADDQRDLLDALRLLLKGAGIGMDAVTSPDAVVDAVASGTYDLLLMDLNYTGDTTSGREGIDLLARVQQRDSLLPVVVMTGWGSVDLAVETMRRGVCDFVQKPWDNQELLNSIRRDEQNGRGQRQSYTQDEVERG